MMREARRMCVLVLAASLDKLFAVKIGSRVCTPITDIQGTVWGFADESVSVVARWTYNA